MHRSFLKLKFPQNHGFVDGIRDLANPIPGFVAGIHGFANPVPGFANRDSGFANSVLGFVAGIHGLANPVPGFVAGIHGFANPVPSFMDSTFMVLQIQFRVLRIAIRGFGIFPNKGFVESWFRQIKVL